MIITYIEDGISKDREATADEVAYIKLAQADAEKSRAAELAESKAKAEAKVSAQAKLAALGLTEEEVASILG